MPDAVESPAGTRTEESVRQTVVEIIAELCPSKDAEVGSTSRLVEDLGYHSLALLELAFALEDEFELTPIDEQSAQRITTVSSIGDHVVEEIRERGGLAAPGSPA